MYYGYDLVERNIIELESLIQDIKKAKEYTDENNFTFCFITEGYKIEILNNIFNKMSSDDINLYSYINLIPVIEKEYCTCSWPNILNKRYITDFLNPDIKNIDLTKYSEEFQKNNIISIPNFISKPFLEKVKSEFENYQWWSYSIIPNNNIWQCNNYRPFSDDIMKDRFLECHNNLENKNFCYRFKKDLNDHYTTCPCMACQMYDTVKSFPITSILCKIAGVKNIIPGEMFISNYGKDDFITMHHDLSKGDLAVTFTFSYDWIPEYGGILHLCDDDNNIITSIVPKLGSLNIFRIQPIVGTKHFVSTVNVDKNRYSLLAWYYFDKENI